MVSPPKKRPHEWIDSPRSIKRRQLRFEYEIDENENDVCELQTRRRPPDNSSVSVAATSMVPAVDDDKGAAGVRGVGSALWRGTEVHMSGERTAASYRAERQAHEIFGKSKLSTMEDSCSPDERARSPNLSSDEALMRPAHFPAGNVPAPLHIAVDRPAHFPAGGDGCHQHKSNNMPANFPAGGDECRQNKSNGTHCPLEKQQEIEPTTNDDGNPQPEVNLSVPPEPLPPLAKNPSMAPDCSNPYASTGPWPSNLMEIVAEITNQSCPCPKPPEFQFSLTMEATDSNMKVMRKYEMDL